MGDGELPADGRRRRKVGSAVSRLGFMLLFCVPIGLAVVVVQEDS